MPIGLLLLALQPLTVAQPVEADVCVYGGSAAGFTAAIQVARMGSSVVLVEPGGHIGGMSVEGLGSSDINNHNFRNDVAIGGLAREFYLRMGRRYGKQEPQYKFESHVAEGVIADWLREHRVRVELNQPLRAVRKQGTRLIAIETAQRTYRARMFLDATIEGDLLAKAGVRTVIGREANALYGETRNGIREENTYRQFTVRVDPYRRPGDPASGVIPTIQDEPLGTPGEGDARIQGYCFRLCLTRNPDNQIPISKPDGYDPGVYEIYRRYLKAGGTLFKPVANLPNGKTDLGSWHDLSANLYGMNHAYPGGDEVTRARVYGEHRAFMQGLIHFLTTDPAVPEATKKDWLGWGLCRDEFTDNGGWPRSLYVRDARRMVSDYVITEQHVKRVNGLPVADPVGVAYWPPDTHHVRRIVRDGAAYNEGFVFGGEDWGPFGVSYRAMTPRASEAVNLLTPTCVSSSHVAYGAIRL
ncbi:MAG: FAD-dependent oxidoreductase, partial [Bryobacteraceae bacterium]|nr:FAD-dependent oxidoreductase [Bryobacteraceae bacterium]